MNATSLRDPRLVMRLSRLGSMHQCRLSFMRVLTRRMAEENWSFARPKFDIDENGVGHAVYVAQGPERAYSLVAFAHDLPPEMRSDRVIATAWDATFTLFDGIPTEDDIVRLSQNVPYQEAGRVTEKELSVSRANRSVRLWEHFVDALSRGHQPDADKIEAVGYLMRTTAVYGSGKLGASDYGAISDRPEFAVPFQVEMLSVFLTRAFVRDLVNHMAQMRGGDSAVAMSREIAHGLGIGNSTGLGLGPFIINHPLLFNNWIMAREEAIARVRSVETVSQEERNQFHEVLQRSLISVSRWKSEHPVQIERLTALRADIDLLKQHLANGALDTTFPWDKLVTWSEQELSEEGQEYVASLILEPYSDLVDDLASSMSDIDPDTFRIDGSLSVDEMRALIEARFGWALNLDWGATENCARAWYVSAEKLEPRVGERFEEPISQFEIPLAPARDAVAAHAELRNWEGTKPIAEFLLRHPEHRHTIRRAQIGANAPYSEINDNTISSELFPVDLLRVKLAFFGATQFSPRSDRWVRICMYGNAPYPEDLTNSDADLWVYPEVTA
ncbi:hypothetical protein [Pacificoceanicola onchidii]|uniref:hypothetical protein n=1 Tax=Pacificoceanicola onchidii TaxID=2562685 RepID=UPI0010A46ACF|nr:hypothetical protein [Pacificoceanicola onchidii]